MTGDLSVTTELIRAQVRRLKLPGLGKAFEQLGRQARDGRWQHEDYLRESLAAEEMSRNDSVIRNRIWGGSFPRDEDARWLRVLRCRRCGRGGGGPVGPL
jgi:DNA replication protein DnaC